MSSPRVISLCPGLIDEIEQCWLPHHFREAIKRSKNAFKPHEYLAMIITRIDFVIDYKANLEAREMLKELRDEVEEILNLDELKRPRATHFQNHEKHLRILEGKNSPRAKAIKEKESQFLENNKESILKEITLKVFEETQRDKSATARRLGISKGALVQRLINYGAYP